MRITNNSVYISFQKQLTDIQERKFKETMKLTSGRALSSIADSPKKLVNVKQLTNIIDRNEAYKDNIEGALNELYVVSEQIDALEPKLSQIRQLTIEGIQTGNSANLNSLGTYMKGILEDLVREANSDFNGHYIFSGTKTMENSIIPNPPETNNQPFELIEGVPTVANPSGLSVSFKGNNKDRAINKDESSTEVINLKASDLFGGAGDEVFEPIIDIINIFMFRPDGAPREDTDILTNDEIGSLNNYQKQIAQQSHEMNTAASINGSRINRLQAIRDQIEFENLRLKDYRSLDEDTDYAETAMNLAREDTALQYSLQAGARLSRLSLFDYLG